jgi:hypothetical protein
VNFYVRCRFTAAEPAVPLPCQDWPLCAQRLVAKGKRTRIAATAVARELAAFLWDIARYVEPVPMRPATT